MGWRTAWVSEIEPYASAVLKKHFPSAPNHGDITQIKGEQVERVDILCGGFPCQDISGANPGGTGLEGARSGLWSHYARLIEEIKPRYVVIENSPLLRSKGLETVLRQLTAFGYDAEWHCIPASAVGAPHLRDRIWVVAYSNSVGRNEVVESIACGEEVEGTVDPSDYASVSRGKPRWAPEPAVARVADGIPARVDRLRCLGNSLVPQVAYTIFQAIECRERALAA